MCMGRSIILTVIYAGCAAINCLDERDIDPLKQVQRMMTVD